MSNDLSDTPEPQPDSRPEPQTEVGPPWPWIPQRITLKDDVLDIESSELWRYLRGLVFDHYEDAEEVDDDGWAKSEYIEWMSSASEEQVIAYVFGWYLRALNPATHIDFDMVHAAMHHRYYLRDDACDPDEAARFAALGLAGDPMMPGFHITNCGIEEDTLARIYLRVLRVHDFLVRFTGEDEFDHQFQPHDVYGQFMRISDELLYDVTNWCAVHTPRGDGSVLAAGPAPTLAEAFIADESELIRRRFGYDEKFCGEHPGETDLKLRLDTLLAQFKPVSNRREDKFRRKYKYAKGNDFWTPDRIQAALDLGLEN